MQLSIGDAIAVVAVCATITVGVVKLPFYRLNGAVRKEVCDAVHKGLDKRLDSVDQALARVEGKLDKVIEGG